MFSKIACIIYWEKEILLDGGMYEKASHKT
jgi:hypothetical protein